MADRGGSSGARPGSATSTEADLVEQYRPVAYAIAREHYWPGGEIDDVRQEALLGLVRGIRSYREGRGLTLESFLRLAIRRQVWTALKAAVREKHGPLNHAARVMVDEDDGAMISIVEMLPSGVDIHDQLVARLELEDVIAFLPRLSLLERRSLVGIAIGLSYAEIEGVPTSRDAKKVDNAVQRARRKMARAA